MQICRWSMMQHVQRGCPEVLSKHLASELCLSPRFGEAIGMRSLQSSDQTASAQDGRCFVCSISSGIASLATASCGHLVCSSCSTSKKGGACLNCKPNASKSNEKTVSFDRETVFTYIKQTPETTPR
ncbi:unnamed protein product [Effrenium voratum]|nr:unnamed protein product [Effrenium voratum]